MVRALRDDIRPEQVTLIVAPPHLLEKWKRELVSIQPDIHVERPDRHEDIRHFMTTTETRSAVTWASCSSSPTPARSTPGTRWRPSAPALHVVEPPPTRPASGKIIPFRRLEAPAFEVTPAQQLALF